MSMLLSATPRRRGRLRQRLTRALIGPTIDPDRPYHWLGHAVLRAAAAGVALAAVAYLFLRLQQYHVAMFQLWLAFAGGLLVVALGRAATVRPPRAPQPVDYDAAELGPRPFATADRWAQRLSVTSGDVEWYTRVVHDRLRQLVAERLRQRHGVRITRNPPQAQQLLGVPLYRFLTEPLSRTPTPAELDRVITLIEEI